MDGRVVNRTSRVVFVIPSFQAFGTEKFNGFQEMEYNSLEIHGTSDGLVIN